MDAKYMKSVSPKPAPKPARQDNEKLDWVAIVHDAPVAVLVQFEGLVQTVAKAYDTDNATARGIVKTLATMHAKAETNGIPLREFVRGLASTQTVAPDAPAPTAPASEDNTGARLANLERSFDRLIGLLEKQTEPEPAKRTRK
jgi:hypothetical protein